MRDVSNLVTKLDSTDPTNFPDDRFKDDAVAGDNTGSELLKTWPNDILQALYSIIRFAGDVPDNVIGFTALPTFPSGEKVCVSLKSIILSELLSYALNVIVSPEVLA